MTNKDNFLKEGTNIDEFTFKFDEWHIKNSDVKGYGEALFRFLQEETKPTLTNDERVILRNIKNNKAIGRDKDNCLYFGSKGDGRFFINSTFGHLFQFIKERRRIRNKGVTKWR